MDEAIWLCSRSLTIAKVGHQERWIQGLADLGRELPNPGDLRLAEIYARCALHGDIVANQLLAEFRQAFGKYNRIVGDLLVRASEEATGGDEQAEITRSLQDVHNLMKTVYRRYATAARESLDRIEGAA